MNQLTESIKRKLKEEENKIIIKAMGDEAYKRRSSLSYIKYNYRAKPNKKPDFSTDEGKMKLFHWLTEHPELWKNFSEWYNNYFIYQTDAGSHICNFLEHFITNLPTLFVTWLYVTEEGWWEECSVLKIIPSQERRIVFIAGGKRL